MKHILDYEGEFLSHAVCGELYTTHENVGDPCPECEAMATTVPGYIIPMVVVGALLQVLAMWIAFFR